MSKKIYRKSVKLNYAEKIINFTSNPKGGH